MLVQFAFVSTVQITQSRHIDGHDSNASGHFGTSKKAVSAFQQFAQIELQTTTHAANSIGFVGIFIFHFIAFFIQFILASDEILEIGRTNFCGIFKKQFGVFPIPIKFFGDVHRWNREGKRLAVGIAFGHYGVISFVDDVHFLLEMLVTQVGNLVHAAFLCPDQKVVVEIVFEEMVIVFRRDLGFQIFRHDPVQGDVRERRLSPTSRNV